MDIGRFGGHEVVVFGRGGLGWDEGLEMAGCFLVGWSQKIFWHRQGPGERLGKATELPRGAPSVVRVSSLLLSLQLFCDCIECFVSTHQLLHYYHWLVTFHIHMLYYYPRTAIVVEEA